MAINVFVPKFRVEECLKEIKDCLEKGWTGLGYKTVEMEDAWKSFTGLPNAHFINSNTAGLEMAFEILKIDKGWSDGDEVITTPITFISTNHAILHNKLKPVFADIDDTMCLDPESVRKKINNKTRAIIFVGIGGNTGNYPEICSIAKENNLSLILDAAHMSGTRLDGATPGKEADVVVYSFQAVKNLPTSDSGMICFREKKHDEMVRKLSWLGINKDTYARMSGSGSYKWMYDVEYTGWKYNGNSIAAAIGLAQLRYLDQDNAYRRQICRWYDAAFKKDTRVKTISQAENCESSRHLYQLLVPKRDEMMLYLHELEIFPGVHYRDNTEYRMYEYAKGTCPKAKEASDQLISLPMHLNLTKSDVDTVIAAVKGFLDKQPA